MSTINDLIGNVLKAFKESDAQKPAVNEKKAKALEDIAALQKEFEDKTLAETKTLGLTRLDYEAPTDDELYAAAKNSLAEKYSAKKTAASNDAESKRTTLSEAIEEAERSAAKDKSTVDDNYGAAKAEIENSALKRGIARSSIAQGAINELANTSAAKKQEIDDRASEKRNALKEQLAAIDGDLQTLMNGLDESEREEIKAAYEKLKAASEAKAEEVIKYNNSLEEKEKNFALKNYDAVTEAQLEEFKNDYDRKKLYVALDYYLSIDDKAEALRDFLSEESMKDYLGNYYDYMVNILRNRAAN